MIIDQPTILNINMEAFCDTIRKGHYIIIDERPCKLVEIERLYKGIPGIRNCRFTYQGMDVFTDELRTLVTYDRYVDKVEVSNNLYSIVDVINDNEFVLFDKRGEELTLICATIDLTRKLIDLYKPDLEVEVTSTTSMGLSYITDFKIIEPVQPIRPTLTKRAK